MDSDSKRGPTIYRRRCRRYFPADADEQLSEFLRDRYRHSAVGTVPCGPFCRCGLLRDEHRPDAIANAPQDLERRERLVRERTLVAARRSRLARSRTLAQRGDHKLSHSVSPPPAAEGRHQPSSARSPFLGSAEGDSVLDWDPVRDTVEEPSDVSFDAPIEHEKCSDRPAAASEATPGPAHHRVRSSPRTCSFLMRVLLLQCSPVHLFSSSPPVHFSWRVPMKFSVHLCSTCACRVRSPCRTCFG